MTKIFFMLASLTPCLQHSSEIGVPRLMLLRNVDNLFV